MENGVGKEEILGRLTEMFHNLESADATLHESLSCIREDLLLSQSERLVECQGMMELVENHSGLMDKEGYKNV